MLASVLSKKYHKDGKSNPTVHIVDRPPLTSYKPLKNIPFFFFFYKAASSHTLSLSLSTYFNCILLSSSSSSSLHQSMDTTQWPQVINQLIHTLSLYMEINFHYFYHIFWCK